MDNYQVIAEKLANFLPFNGNTMRAEWGYDGVYRVYSYRTVIATRNTDGNRSADFGYYSVTTSKQQGIVARVWFGKSLKDVRK